MNEKEWAAEELRKARNYIQSTILSYDEGRIERMRMELMIALFLQETFAKVYDHAFKVGVASAELDGDTTEEGEIDIDFEEEDPS